MTLDMKFAEIAKDARKLELIGLVREGYISPEVGAQRLSITVEDFMKLMETTPNQ